MSPLLFGLVVSCLFAATPFAAYYATCYVSRRFDRGRIFYAEVADLLTRETKEWSISEGDYFSPWRFRHHETGVSLRIGTGVPILDSLFDDEKRVVDVAGSRPGCGWRQLLRHRASRLVSRRDKIRNYEALISNIETLGEKKVTRIRRVGGDRW